MSKVIEEIVFEESNANIVELKIRGSS